MLRNECRVFYDKGGDRLVYIGLPADESYWDDHWGRTPDLVRRPDRFVRDTTQRFLKAPARVLDAGCGLANSVFGLHGAGFDAYGVDYAPNTVAFVNEMAPELKVTQADVRAMAFDDGYFDGVWSLGVVEHFFDGYLPILTEMKRVLKPGGLAFVTVPSLSPLRRLKAGLGGYPAFAGDPEGFYQFALPPAGIVETFEANGYRLKHTEPRGGFKGFKDEVGPLRAPMQAMYDSRSTPLRAIRAGFDRLLGPFSYHTRLYVFEV